MILQSDPFQPDNPNTGQYFRRVKPCVKSSKQPACLRISHIIGVQFGAPDIVQNITAMKRTFNQNRKIDGRWFKMEKEILEELLTTESPLTMVVNLKYINPSNHIPNEIYVEVYENNQPLLSYRFTDLN